VLQRLPVFPLNLVMFPGATMGLHVFEDRYRALVQALLGKPDRATRLFAVVGIREGYEVGQHGKQSLHRVGCVVQLTEAEEYDDGRFDIEVVGRQRMRLDSMESSGDYLVGEVETLTERTAKGSDVASEASRTTDTFHRYRDQLAEIRGGPVLDVDLPHDPEYLSYTLAATCLLTMQQQQDLLEADTSLERLVMVRHDMTQEMRAMRAISSLPAAELARTGWSPN
jgi:Lon protease-like protein